jgi:hypothetical protein
MIRNFFRRIFGKKTSETEVWGNEEIVAVDRDKLGPDADAALIELAKETSGLTFFKGRIEHGYSLDFVGATGKCPRCGAPTRQQYAEWIYATQTAPRVMMAPAGYFCPRCPTVIVDEGMIRAGVKRQFRYQGVLGLDPQKDKLPDLLRTWNGESAIHILGERGNPQGIVTEADISSPRAARLSRVASPRQRSTKKSRKQNRRKK